MILYVNSCVRKNSRTDRLARVLLSKFDAEKILKEAEEKIVNLNV